MTDTEMVRQTIEGIAFLLGIGLFAIIGKKICDAINESIDINERDPKGNEECKEKKPKN